MNIKKRLTIIFACSIFLFSKEGKAQYQMNGDASSSGNNCYVITPDASSQVGSIWNTSLINLNNPFDFTFLVNLGCDTAGADGICFGLQTQSTSVSSGTGNGMGLGGISPSLGVYIDTYQNYNPDFDPWYDHISINSNGDVNHSTANNLSGPVQASATQFNVEDCINHTLRISWTPATQNMLVWFDGSLRLNYVGNIVTNIFGGNPNVYWGFTGGTGLYHNLQTFCILIEANFSFNTVCQGNPTQFTDLSTSGTPITNWAWNFGDGSAVLSGGNAALDSIPTHTYAAAGTYVVQETVTNSGAGTSTVSHSVIVLAPPTATATGGITVCPGQNVNLTGTVSGPSNIPVSFTSAGTNNNITIPDGGIPFGWTGTGSNYTTSTIPVTGLNAGWTLTSIVLNITHPYDGDVIAYLFDPCGNSIQLISNCFGVNFTNTSFTPAASTIITSGTSPFNGIFIPSGGAAAWTAFITATQGCAGANGNWQLRVGDDDPFDVGTIDNWTLNFINPATPTYVWAPTLNMTNSTTLTPTVAPTVTTTYTLTATNSYGCTDSAQTTVTIVPVINVAVNSPTTCSGIPVTLIASGATSYSWSAGTSNAAGDSAIVAPTVTGTYTVTGTSGTCTGTAVATVTVSAGILVSVNSPVICAGQTATLNAIGGTTYNWTAGANSTGGNGSTATAIPALTTTYTVTGNTNGCIGTAVSTVTVNPVPTVSVNSPSICPGLTAILTANGATSYTWSAGATSTGINTATATPAATSAYTVTGTSLGCSNTAIATVTVGASIPITATGDTICVGSIAHLTANGATTYTWSSGATSTGANSADASPNTTTTYTVTGTNGGCDGTTTVTVYLHPSPIASFSAPLATSEIYPVVNFTNYSFEATQWSWNFGDYSNPATNTSSLQNPSHTYADTGKYCVTLVVKNATCTDSAINCIDITPEYSFYIPNAFTPNGDGVNDEFFGVGNYINSYQMNIYNRWGELIFYSDNINKHWDGRVNENIVQEDTYVYVFNVVDAAKGKHKYIGNVTVLR